MKIKILIVDDEPDVLESTALVVESLGYNAIKVSNPGAILDTLERERPDALLQDLRMPGLNLSGLIASIRSNPATAQIPIIFFSANVEVAGTAARYDVWGHLAKPFSKQELAHLLEEATGAPRRPRIKGIRDVSREVGSVFHDYWNLLAALSNYIVILDEATNLPPALRKCVTGLDEIVLQLESKTDRLHSYLRGVLEARESASKQDSSESMKDSA